MKLKMILFVMMPLLLGSGHVFSEGRVSAIDVSKSGPGPFDESFVRAHIEFEPGMLFERYALSRDIKALMDTGRFSDVKAYAVEDGSDVRLVYQVVNRRILSAPVAIEGEDRFSEHHVRRLIGLEPGDYVDDAVLGQRSVKVKDEYRRKHYPDIEVSWKITDDRGRDGFADVAVVVREGRKARLAGIAFEGNTAFSSYELGRLMKRPAWWNPFWWMRKQKLDEEIAFAGRLEIRKKYLDAGYLDVEVDEPVSQRDKGGNVILAVKIVEGPRYSINSIKLSGVDLFPELAVREVISIKSGDTASFTAVQDAVGAVNDFYGSRGYIDTVVKKVLEPVEGTQSVDMYLDVQEGSLCRIRRIDIAGNTRTRDKVIRRELLVEPGDVFNQVKVRASEKRLSNLGYFGSVRSFPTATQLNDQRNLVIEVEEQRTGQFMGGVGFSSIDRATVFMEISQGNFDLFGWPRFTGGGQKLKLSAQLGSVRRDLMLSFVEPWFMNRKLRFGFDLYDRLVKYDDYHSRRTGATIALGKAVGDRSRVDLSYSLEKLMISDIADTNEYFTETGSSYYFAEEQDHVSSSVRAGFTHDVRDNPFVPTEGGKFRLSAGITGGPFGFDKDFYEAGVSYSSYFPAWLDHVLSVKASYDIVEAFGDTEEVPIDDRLFAGGGRTLRGFRYRDVGPKATRQVDTGGGAAEVYHKPVGGGSRFLATAEYSIPVAHPIRFALFADAGNVWADPFEIDFSDLAASAGGGLRFDVPGFPIRIDYADVLKKDDDLTRTESWVLWIGYDF